MTKKNDKTVTEIAAALGMDAVQARALQAAFARAVVEAVEAAVEAARAARGNPYAAKLDRARAQRIRAEYRPDKGMGYSALARKYGVSAQSIKSVVKGRSYPAKAAVRAA